MTAAAGFAVPRAFRACFARRGVDGTRVVAHRFAAAIGADDFFGMAFDEFFEFLVASGAFVLQNGHLIFFFLFVYF